MTIVATSFKQYFDHERVLAYCRAAVEIAAQVPAVSDRSVTVGILPSFVSIPAASELLSDTPIRLGAQDVGPYDFGPYTGEVAAADLHRFGCTLVEIGHAERRRLFGEDAALISAKTAVALSNGLTPLFCVGEPEAGEPGAAVEFCVGQVLDALPEGTAAEFWLAYEPVWAIGAPEPAPADYVRAVASGLRERLAGSLPGLSILYGGSAGPGLLARLGDEVDGLFLGRFAHDPEALRSVVLEAAERR